MLMAHLLTYYLNVSTLKFIYDMLSKLDLISQ